MSTNFIQPGSRLTYTNTSGATITSGSVVVVGKQIGIATGDIPDTETGELAMEGVFEVPKVAAAIIAAGEDVIWDASAGEFDDNAAIAASGDVSGACSAWEDAGATVTTLKIKLNTGIGTVTP